MTVGPVTPVTGPAAPSTVSGVAAAYGAAAGAVNTSLPAPDVATTPPATPSSPALVAAIAEASLLQDGLSGLFADLTAAAQSPALPPTLQAAVRQVLAAQTPLSANVTPEQLKAAFEGSGLFLEAQLAQAQTPQAVPGLLAGDFKAQLLQLVQTLIGDGAAADAPGPGVSRRKPGPPPPVRGGAVAGQAPAKASLDLDAGEPAIRKALARDARSALARLQLSQFASAPKPGEVPTWRFELPVATAQGWATGQFVVTRDGTGTGGGEGHEPHWRVRFALDAPPTGPVQVDLAVAGAVTRVTLWVADPDAYKALSAAQGELVRDLGGTPKADVAVRILPGEPPPVPVAAGTLVSRSA